MHWLRGEESPGPRSLSPRICHGAKGSIVELPNRDVAGAPVSRTFKEKLTRRLVRFWIENQNQLHYESFLTGRRDRVLAMNDLAPVVFQARDRFRFASVRTGSFIQRPADKNNLLAIKGFSALSDRDSRR